MTWDPALVAFQARARVHESVDAMRRGGVVDGQKHPNFQLPHSEEIEVWSLGVRMVCAQVPREGLSAPFRAGETSSRTPDKVRVGHEASEPEP